MDATTRAIQESEGAGMTALQVLMTIGKICDDHSGCQKCPLNFINEPTRMGCAWDFVADRKIAKQVIKVCEEERKRRAMGEHE